MKVHVLVIVAVASFSAAAVAEPAPELCGHGKPGGLELRDAAADPHAVIFFGRVTAQHVSPDSIHDRVGTIEVDVKTIVRGSASATHVTVPAAAEGCLPKAACLATVFEQATPGTMVVVACVVPATGAPRTAIVRGDGPVPEDMRRCLAIADTAPQGADHVTEAHVAAIAAAYVAGGALAKTCAARIACDAAHRDVAVRAIVHTIGDAKTAPEAKLERALGLAQPVSSGAALLGCATMPTFFEPDLGGGDPTNALIARTMIEGMLAATRPDHRKRWANLLWGLMIDWHDKPGESASAVRGLGTSLAQRSIKMLRALGGADDPHYQESAAIIDAANKP